MGILMTVEATLEIEVRLPHMAVAALRNGFLHGRRMARMTARTAYFLVLPSGGRQISRRNGMTFHTVGVCQRDRLLCPCNT